MTKSIENSTPDNIEKQRCPDIPFGEISDLEAAKIMFRWLEGQAIETYTWYIREKESKARASKVLRVFSIFTLALGAILPLVSLLTSKLVQPEWGYVSLTAGGATLLFDRAFGYSSSWSRYMRSAASIGASINRYQAAWLDWQSSQSPEGDWKISLFMESVFEPFAADLAAAIEAETEAWASEFTENVLQLHAALPLPKSQ